MNNLLANLFILQNPKHYHHQKLSYYSYCSYMMYSSQVNTKALIVPLHLLFI